MFAVFPGRRGSEQRRQLYTSRTSRPTTTFLTPLATFNPNPFGFANSLDRPTPASAANAANGGDPGELLRRQPGPARRREHDDQRRQVRLPRAAARAAPPAVAGPAVQRELRVRQPEDSLVPDLPPRRLHDSRLGRPGRHHARVQDERASTICRSARAAAAAATSTASWIASSATGRSAVVSRVQSGRLIDFGNVRLVGMTAKRRAGHVQAAVRRRRQEGLDAAAGRDRQHDPRVQRQRRRRRRATARSARRPAGTSRRPTVRTASRSTTARSTATAARARWSSPDRCTSSTTSASRSGSPIVGRTNFEFRLEMLNAFNQRELRAGGAALARRWTTTR